MAHDLDAIAATLKEASYRAATPMDAEVDALVTIARWAQNAPHYEDCDARGWRDGERPPCSCRRDEALRPFGGDRAIRTAALLAALVYVIRDGWR